MDSAKGGSGVGCSASATFPDPVPSSTIIRQRCLGQGEICHTTRSMAIARRSEKKDWTFGSNTKLIRYRTKVALAGVHVLLPRVSDSTWSSRSVPNKRGNSRPQNQEKTTHLLQSASSGPKVLLCYVVSFGGMPVFETKSPKSLRKQH